jgi:hypothetical protein
MKYLIITLIIDTREAMAGSAMEQELQLDLI